MPVTYIPGISAEGNLAIGLSPNVLKNNLGLGSLQNHFMDEARLYDAVESQYGRIRLHDQEYEFLNSANQLALVNVSRLAATQSITVGGVHVVRGSLGATANCVLVTSGTGGATAQASPVTIDGSGNVTGVSNLTASGTVNAQSGGFASLQVGGVNVATASQLAGKQDTISVSANSLLGNNTGSAAGPSSLSASQARSLLGLATTDSPTFAGLQVGGVNVVRGSLGSTANCVLVTSGTGGATAQSSPVSIDGSGNVSGVGNLIASAQVTAPLLLGTNGVGYAINASTGVTIASNMALAATSSINPQGTRDIFMSRHSAGVWQMGTTANNALGSLNLANVNASGTVLTNSIQSNGFTDIVIKPVSGATGSGVTIQTQAGLPALRTLGSGYPRTIIGPTTFDVGERLVVAGTVSIAKSIFSNTNFESLVIDPTTDANNYRLGSRIGSAGGTTRGLQLGNYNAAGTWASWLGFDSSGNATFNGLMAVNSTASFGAVIRSSNGNGILLATNGSYVAGTRIQNLGVDGKLRIANFAGTGGGYIDTTVADTFAFRNLADNAGANVTLANLTASGTVKADRVAVGLDIGLVPVSSGASTVWTYHKMRLVSLSSANPSTYVAVNGAGGFQSAHVEIPMTSTSAIGLELRGVASQAGNFISAFDSSGSSVFSVSPSGNLTASGTINAVAFGIYPHVALAPFLGGLGLADSMGIKWANNGDYLSTKDTGINRASGGIVEINNGTVGTLRDLSLRNLTASGTVNAQSGSFSSSLQVGGVNVVRGSFGATANRVLVTSGTGGATAQSCPVSIDGSGNVTGLGNLTASGTVGINTGTTPSSQFQVNSAGPFVVAAIIRGAASQILNLQEWQNSSGTALVSIGSTGSITTSGGIFGTSANFSSFVDVNGTLFANSSNGIRLNTRAFIRSPQEGVINLTNNVSSNFNRLVFGLTTSAFPSLKRSGTTLEVRLGDDSDHGNFQTGDLISYGSITVTGNLTATGYTFRSGASDPSTLDIADGQATDWHNTTSGVTKRFINVAGTLKSITYT